MGGQPDQGKAPVSSAAAIEPVIARMEQIGAGLPEADGVARFNELYLAVTRAVAARTGAAFEDPGFIARLDVVFAGLYFSAVDDSVRGAQVPNAWAPLFEARGRSGIAPIQFALAGMNAHINHDLALALVAACHELGLELDEDTPQHRDYLAVNAILEQVEATVKARFAVGIVAKADEALGTLDDVLANWSVARARDFAWTTAKALAVIGANRVVREQFLLALDRAVGFQGRGLLVRTQ